MAGYGFRSLESTACKFCDGRYLSARHDPNKVDAAPEQLAKMPPDRRAQANPEHVLNGRFKESRQKLRCSRSVRGLVQAVRSEHAEELLPAQTGLTKLTKPAKGGYCQFRRVMQQVNTREFCMTSGRHMQSQGGLGVDVPKGKTRRSIRA